MAKFTVESLCNQALDLIGYKRHIGNIYDGSAGARIALNLYSQTRDSLLEALKPTWAHKDAPLTLLKSAPNIVNNTADYTGVVWSSNYPAIPWLYEYSFPTDCVTPLQVKPQAATLPQWRPREIPFRLVFDVPGDNRSILCNEPSAILTYVAQVLDPNDWHNDFTDLFVKTLAKEFEQSLGKPMPPQPRGQDANPPR